MSEETKQKILVVEDEKHLAEGLELNLSLNGYDVKVASNGRLGLELWESYAPDLIILDIMMPELDGYGVMSFIRDKDERIPILVLSAKNESTDKIKALKKGVDDYLGKPFNLDELLLRVSRLLRRSDWSKNNEEVSIDQFSFGENTIDFVQNHAQTNNGQISLTALELRILRYFIENPNRPLNREEILEAGWGYNQETSTRTLDNFIVRFRKYFEKDPKKPIHFKSVRSVGYIFDPAL